MIPHMNYQQYRTARRLVHSCCNYDSGYCLLLDNGEECICPQSITYSLICKWFRAAVLPLDEVLYCRADNHRCIRIMGGRFRCIKDLAAADADHQITAFFLDQRDQTVDLGPTAFAVEAFQDTAASGDGKAVLDDAAKAFFAVGADENQRFFAQLLGVLSDLFQLTRALDIFAETEKTFAIEFLLSSLFQFLCLAGHKLSLGFLVPHISAAASL